ncbi:glycosyltransferase family 4 protein [Sphingobacterium faecium]
MKYNFVLPFYTKVPSGGTKIMYEYANRLALLGHEVTVYHCIEAPYFKYPKNRPFILRKLITLMIYKNSASSPWFSFCENVKLKFIDRLTNKYIADADVTVVTWWSLVQPLSLLSSTKGIKVNLIQDYENWEGNEELLHQSYSFSNILKIGISPYVIDSVNKFDNNIHYIPNAIDSTKYFTDINFNERDNFSFCMLYSKESRKGTDVGIKAFIELKSRHKNISLTLFGTSERPVGLPDWIEYFSNLSDLKDVYNRHAYFISNSLEEGWGLPVHEAMACGCVIICTAISGHRQFYEGSKGVLTYEKGNSQKLEVAIESLIHKSTEQLIQLSADNRAAVSSFEWNTVVNRFLEIVKK